MGLFNRFAKYAFGLCIFVFALSLIYYPEHGIFPKSGVAEAKIDGSVIGHGGTNPALDNTNPGIQVAMAVQERHTAGLMAIQDIVGTATGLTDEDDPAVVIFAKRMPADGSVPKSLEGFPVIVEITGELFAMKGPPPGKGQKKEKVDPTARFGRPVPIGVSTGNVGECSAGTIGARVRDSSGNVYALSNNHVYALENSAPILSNVLQPGRYDTDCFLDLNNVIGQLADYEELYFDGSDNRIDAAIALSDINYLGNSTPLRADGSDDGYGTPKSAVVAAQLNDTAQKYGRTTGLTKGTIAGINATVNVTYGSGTVKFVDQIVVYSRKPFIKPGDSGSLLVTDPGRNPVGLLFAGNSSGKYAIANRIDLVLGALDISIDGE